MLVPIPGFIAKNALGAVSFEACMKECINGDAFKPIQHREQ